MDELTVNKTKYISSKRAAKESGYAQDYIGQLIRQGKLQAERVGRSWYVSEQSLKEFCAVPDSSSGGSTPAVGEHRPQVREIPVLPQTIEYALPKTWSSIRYSSDDSDLYPISVKRDEKKADEMIIVKATESIPTKKSTDTQPVKISVVRRNDSLVPEQSVSGIRTISRTPVAKRAQASAIRSKSGYLKFGVVFLVALLLGMLMPIIS